MYLQLTGVILFLFTSKLFTEAQSIYTKDVSERINRVENNLTSWVRLDSSSNWNIYQRMKENNVNGISIAVINNYKIEWIKSYGFADTAAKRKVTNETLFQSASIGKSINGFAWMKLVRDKKLNLHKDINTYLRSWQFLYDTASHGKKIGVGELLSHTAGLSVHGFDGYKWNDSLPTLLQILNGEKPAKPSCSFCI